MLSHLCSTRSDLDRWATVTGSLSQMCRDWSISKMDCWLGYLEPPGPLTSYYRKKKKALIIPSVRRAEKSKVVAWKDISSVATGMSKRKFPLPGCMGKEF